MANRRLLRVRWACLCFRRRSRTRSRASRQTARRIRHAARGKSDRDALARLPEGGLVAGYHRRVAKLELSRELSLPPEDAWAHASNLADLGDWLVMHQGWRGDLPEELVKGATIVGVAGAKGLRNRVTWTVRD